MYRSRSLFAAVIAAASVALPAHARVPVTLKGSPASMVRQNEVARHNELAFLANTAQVEDFVAKGRLVPLSGNADYEMAKGVGFPYARPETRNFVEMFAPEYRAACGMKLVITSATRPLDHQPKNAHKLSVHPTGMAVDMRVPKAAACRTWLETRLLAMETAGELDATREVHPAHFHVAVFPEGFRKPVGPASLAAKGEDGTMETPAAATAAATTKTGAVRTEPGAKKASSGQAEQPAWATAAGIALSLAVLIVILRMGRRKPDAEPTDGRSEDEPRIDRAA
jgi:hypothetical protein